MWWKSFYIRVRIYEPYGQISLTEETLTDIMEEAKKGEYTTLERKDIKFDMFKKKNTHGKYIKSKGTQFFNIFMPHKKIEPVSMKYMYDNGIHLLRLSRDIFIPIPKPKTVINVAEEVSISIQDETQWQAWSNLMTERINNKYQDVDAQKKAVLYFIIGIAGMVLIGGFILWLIYSSANKGYEAADRFNQVAKSLTGGAPV